ncbi:MAG TPA: tetratricopeptide repeat protein, partial [Longimicrobiaceae bacterium]|nr:tetratricopeptide repeat protein [Longimicrobiaceae bacterium]
MIIPRAVVGLIAVVASLLAGSMAMRSGGVGPMTASAPVPIVAEGKVGAEPVPAEAVQLMEAGRPWRAARVMAGFLASTNVPTAEAILFAARAEAGWGGWSEVREYLAGKPWLDELSGAEGWYWLGRALEESGDVPGASTAYERFLGAADGQGPSDLLDIAELRLGLLRLRGVQGVGGGDPLARVIARSPEIADWLRVLSTESLAATGDTARIRSITSGLPQEAGMRHRGRIALVRAYDAAGDREGEVRTALTLRGLGGTATQRAELSLMAGRAAIAIGDAGVARRELREAMTLAPASSWARESASQLAGMSGVTIADRLAIAEIDERHGNNARAAEGYRGWLAAVAGTAEQRQDVQLRLGRVLFNAGEFRESEAVLRPLLEARAAVAREALMLTGRSQYRRGERETAFATFQRLAARHAGSVEGSEALYTVADLRHDDGEV